MHAVLHSDVFKSTIYTYRTYDLFIYDFLYLSYRIYLSTTYLFSGLPTFQLRSRRLWNG